MALLERVATIIRANLNDLVDRAEDPEKTLKQVILDMRNQQIQVKTQVAIALADERLLAKKQNENEEKSTEWSRRAELAVAKGDDELARAALDRSLSHKTLADNFKQQVADQASEVENLKGALSKLEEKLAEAQAKSDLWVARRRRARASGKAGEAELAATHAARHIAMHRVEDDVSAAEAEAGAKTELSAEDLESRLASLERDDEIERLLGEIKARRGGPQAR
jgi:phage shock protein A